MCDFRGKCRGVTNSLGGRSAATRARRGLATHVTIMKDCDRATNIADISSPQDAGDYA